MAAFFSACFLVLAASPENVMPATSTEHVKTGRCPGPERVVVYTGNETPALWAVSCSKFLHTPVSSCGKKTTLYIGFHSQQQNPSSPQQEQLKKRDLDKNKRKKHNTRRSLTKKRAARDWEDEEPRRNRTLRATSAAACSAWRKVLQ
jgi:hypothetical protein